MTFFNDWALWEKLCFVLGVAIGLTVLAGCFKLIYDARQLRKFTAIAAEKKEEQHRQEMQRTMSVRRGRKPDVPFGIRAIESGIEVDGVWISRPNTPNASAPGSPVIPPVQQPTNPKAAQAAEQNSVTHIPQLVMPESAYGSGGRARSQSPQLGRAASSENLASRDRSPGPDTRRGRPTYQPRQGSHLRFNSVDARQDHAGSDDRNESTKVQRDSGSSSDSESKPPHRVPQHLSPTEGPYQRQYSASPQGRADDQPSIQASQGHLNSLTMHRETHAAETGQLLPRTRGARAGSDESATQDYFSSRSVSPSNDPFQTPDTTPRRGLRPLDPSPPQNFLDSHPANKLRQNVPLLSDGEASEGKRRRQPNKLHKRNPSEVSLQKVSSFVEEV